MHNRKRSEDDRQRLRVPCLGQAASGEPCLDLNQQIKVVFPAPGITVERIDFLIRFLQHMRPYFVAMEADPIQQPAPADDAPDAPAESAQP